MEQKLKELLASVALDEIEARIRVAVEALLADVVAEVRPKFEAQFHAIINVHARQNIAAYSAEKLAELAGIVNAEVARRTA